MAYFIPHCCVMWILCIPPAVVVFLSGLLFWAVELQPKPTKQRPKVVLFLLKMQLGGSLSTGDTPGAVRGIQTHLNKELFSGSAI